MTSPSNHGESFVEYSDKEAADDDQFNLVPDEEDNIFAAFVKEVCRKTNLKSCLILILFIACGTVETVDYSLNGKKFMVNYLTVLNILVVFVATGFFWLVVTIQTKRGFYSKYPQFQRSISLYPKWFFVSVLVMALCDTIALYVAILASREVTAPLRNMLQQGNIPVTMLLSRFYLGHRYRASHLIGASCIIGGIALVIWQVDTDDGDDGSHDTSDAWWSLAFFLSCIPMSLSICLKEHVLNHHSHPVDMHLVNAYVTLIQLVLSLILCPISFLVTMNTTSLTGLGNNLVDGLKCALSGVGCNSQCPDVNQDVCAVSCNLEYAPASVWVYILVCCLFNLLMLWVISENTAALYFVALAAIIPVVSLISTSSLYTAIDLCTVGFTTVQVLGLVIVVLGITVYRLRPDVDCVDDDFEADDVEWNAEEIIDRASREIYRAAQQDPLHDSVRTSSSFQSFNSDGSKPRPSGAPHTPPRNEVRTPRTSPALSQDQHYNGYADKHVRDLARGKDRKGSKGSF